MDEASAHAWLSQELPTLSACVEYTATHGHEAAAIDLAAAAQSFLRLDAQWQRALAMHETALTAANRVRDRLAQANSHYLLGKAGQMLCEFDMATKHLANALNLYAELDDRSGEAYVLHETGILRGMQGNYAAAVAPQTKARDLFLALNNDTARTNAVMHLGFSHSYLGHYDLALGMLSQARQSFMVLGERLDEATALRLLAAVQRQRGELRHASDSARRSLRLAGEAGSRLFMAVARVEVGTAQRDLGDPRRGHGLADPRRRSSPRWASARDGVHADLHRHGAPRARPV